MQTFNYNEKDMELAIIIINYQMAEKLRCSLESLRRVGYDKKSKIVVVNKPSGDGTETMLANNFPLISLISYPKFGVGKMRNVGISQTSSRYVLMLDADTQLLNGRLESIIKFMDENPSVGVVGCKLLNPNLSLQYSCRTFYDLKTIIYRRTPLGKLFSNSGILKRHLLMDWDHNSIQEVDWVMGAFFLIRRRAIEDVGLFSEKATFGFEDVDWCYRARLKNWKTYYLPDVQVIHEYQRSSTFMLNKRALNHFVGGISFYFKYYLRI